VLRKWSTYVAILVFAGLVALIIWAPAGGRFTTVIGLATAGLAFAMQQVIGSFFGWINILSGRIFRIGDRIEMAGVRGDVIDMTPLRTKILEMGQRGSPLPQGGSDPGVWVHGRQYTGRIVTISNQQTFSSPVYNYSSSFEFVWDELVVPVPYRCDWRAADRILLEEAQRAHSGPAAERAMEAMIARYPVPAVRVEPRVFAHATDNWVELTARFMVPVRTARAVRDELTRRVLERFEEHGIEIASATSDVTVFRP